MDESRKTLYMTLEKMRDSKVIAYITGTRPGLETRIHREVMDMFVEHLDALYEKNCGKKCQKISLILHSLGGDTLAGWTLVNLLRMYCRNLEVIVPFLALSTATLISIGADNIVMTKQACLGPIDPSTNGPYNPQIDPYGTLPVSVEHVFGYLNLAKTYGAGNADLLTQAFITLANKVHPLALGNVAKGQMQIRMLAEKLLSKSTGLEEKNISEIVNFLCSDSGSHDYTINRDEAKAMKLPVEIPSKELYQVIRDIYKDYREEMHFNIPFDPLMELGQESKKDVQYVRGLIESADGGTHRFISNFVLDASSANGAKLLSEGWEYEQVTKQ